MSGSTSNKSLLNNSRFYILVFSILLSVLTICWLRIRIPGDQLFYIRTEQVFGLLAVVFLYVALIISPLKKVIGSKSWLMQLIFARRAIGVSAAYFALLHGAFAIWGQIGGLGGLVLLPDRFLWSMGFGGVGLLVLLIMAATSFDRVISWMTLARWKWLHRLVYVASLLVLLHIWMVGTHIAYDWIRTIGVLALVSFFGLEAWRLVDEFTLRFKQFRSKDYFVTLFLCLWSLFVVLFLMVLSLSGDYHSSHQANLVDGIIGLYV